MLSDQATTEYLDEERRLARQASVAQAAYVREVLNGDPDDLAAVSRRLGYDLGSLHLAVVLKAPARRGDDGHTARACGIVARGGGGRGSAPRVPIDNRSAWVWVAVGAEADIPATVSGNARAGVGRPGRGLAGFRTSHREALEASRIAELTDRPLGTRDPLRRRRAGCAVHG